MKIYDISQELYSSVVFPGDPSPQAKQLASMEEGSPYNLTLISMCAHNGTHIDAPKHFINEGKGIDEIDLESVVGKCFVYQTSGLISEQEALLILDKARAVDEECAKRILIKGDAALSLEGAKAIKDKVLLFGNESQTIGPEREMTVVAEIHRILLKSGVVLLEGVRLGSVSEGEYLLFAAPISLKGGDGSPCRAVLIEK